MKNKEFLKQYGFLGIGQCGGNLTKGFEDAGYFFNDSSFNNKTAVSFKMIMSSNEAIHVFMSATGDSRHRSFNCLSLILIIFLYVSI